MAASMRKALLFAKVVTSDVRNAIRVSVPKYVMDERLTMYFMEHTHFYAVDSFKKCKEGDFVIIRELPDSEDKNITHTIEQIVYQRGNYIDPITGKKCAGTEYAEDIKRTCELFGRERPYQKQ